MVLLASLSVGRVAIAQDQTGEVLRYQAPSACPSEVDVRARLQTVLGGELTERLRAARHAIDWNISSQGARFLSRIWLRIDAEGEAAEASPAGLRETTDESCAALIDAGIFIIALSVDPERAAAFLAEDSAAHSESAPTGETCTTSIGCGLHFSVGLAAHLELGLLPAPSASLGVGAQLDLDRVHIGLWLRYALEDAQRWTLNAMPVSLTTSAWLATGEFGYDVLQNRDTALTALARVEAGAFLASPSDALGQTKIVPLLIAGLGVLARWAPIPQLPIEVFAALQVPLWQNVVRVDDVAVYSQPLISGTFALRTRWVF